MYLGSPTQFSISLRRACLLRIVCVPPTLFRRITRLEALIEIVDDIVDMFQSDGDTDQVLGYAGIDLLLVFELFVGCGPGVDC